MDKRIEEIRAKAGMRAILRTDPAPPWVGEMCDDIEYLLSRVEELEKDAEPLKSWHDMMEASRLRCLEEEARRTEK